MTGRGATLGRLDWDKLRVFHAVAQAGSFTHAGEALGLSQSAVSRQISALEQSLNVSLFLRHARGLVLTSEGETLFAAAKEMADRLSQTANTLMDSRQRPRGSLTVTTTVGFGAMWLTPRLKEFNDAYPEVNLQLRLDDREVDLERREADVAIRLHPPQQADLIQRRLFEVKYHLYASGFYVNAHGAPESLEELDKHKLITYGEATPKEISNVNWILNAGRSSRKPREAAFQVNSIIGILNAVKAGIGIAALPDYLCQDQAGLIRILPNAEGPTFETFFVYPEQLRNSKRVRVLLEFMLSKSREWNY